MKYIWAALWAAGWVLFFSQPLAAQDGEAVERIRETYTEVNVGIADCSKKGDEWCGYYLTTITVNAQDGPWPDVGIYSSQQNYWSTTVETSEGADIVLRKLNLETKRSNRDEHEEYLFDDDGQLRFYFCKVSIEGKMQEEYRYYFAEGKLVSYKEKLAVKDEILQTHTEGGVAEILQQAERFKGVFKASFN